MSRHPELSQHCPQWLTQIPWLFPPPHESFEKHGVCSVQLIGWVRKCNPLFLLHHYFLANNQVCPDMYEPGKLFCVNCDGTIELATYPRGALVHGGTGSFWTSLLSQMARLVFLLVLRGQRLCCFEGATEIMLTAIQCVSRIRLHQWFGLQTVGTGHRCLQLDCCLAVTGPRWCRWQKVGLLQLLWWVIILPSSSPFSIQ